MKGVVSAFLFTRRRMFFHPVGKGEMIQQIRSVGERMGRVSRSLDPHWLHFAFSEHEPRYRPKCRAQPSPSLFHRPCHPETPCSPISNPHFSAFSIKGPPEDKPIAPHAMQPRLSLIVIHHLSGNLRAEKIT